MPAPNPDLPTPSTRPELTNVVFLKNEITSEFIEVGDFTYYDTENRRGRFEDENVLYNYGPERLVIGAFTAIGPGAQFLMPGGNHPMVGPSTYPFTMFGGEWQSATLEAFLAAPRRGDTVVGNDVWVGREAMIMPGVRIGDGSVIAARSVVTRDVPAYTIVGGNPASHIRTRFEPDDVRALLDAAWWTWPVEKITANASTIMTGRVAEIVALAGR